MRFGGHHGIENPNRRGGALGQILGAGGVRKKRTFFSHAGGRSSISILRSNSPRPNSPGLWITPYPLPPPPLPNPPKLGAAVRWLAVSAGQGGCLPGFLQNRAGLIGIGQSWRALPASPQTQQQHKPRASAAQPGPLRGLGCASPARVSAPPRPTRQRRASWGGLRALPRA